MKDKSLFNQFLLIVVLGIICILFTVSAAIIAGSINANLFDFKNFNFGNMIPVLLICGFISCAAIGICILFVGRTAFFKAKELIEKNENKNEKGESKK